MAEIQGGIQKQPKRSPQRNAYPFLRVANVTAQGLNLDEIHAIELFEGELERYRLRRGDLLVVEGNGSASQIGRAAVWDGSIKDAVHQNHLIRVRPGCLLNERFLGLVWNSPSNRAELARIASSTSGLHTLSVTKLKRIMLPLPPSDEQRRIVDFLEDHLSRLEAGQDLVAKQRARLSGLSALCAHHLSTVNNGTWQTLADISRLITDGDHNPPKRVLGGVPHVTAKGIRLDGTIDLTAGTYITEDGFEQTARRYRPLAGDVIVTCVGTIGRIAVVPEGVRFSADRNLAAIRVDEDKVIPAYVALALRGTASQLKMARASGSTAQPHLYLRDLRATTIRVPERTEQARILASAATYIDGIAALEGELAKTIRRADFLRRGLLSAAFSGRLTHEDGTIGEWERCGIE
ncbi:restriction endonuclease subunit S [Mycobacterium marinum]|uniref:restriction endonuclease subunit S n=1 Tax=Mycobacterium marinum TaxID=1781 RepID=UPI001FD2853D|nr:restriction endonuclease subunit S [Mycobacterium marinum]